MNQALVIVLFLCGIGLLYAVLIYNRLVALKHQVDKAWGNIDVLLKQRHDELPKLVASCNRYMVYEQETLQRVTEARCQVAAAQESGRLGEFDRAEGALRAGLGQLFALVENYPDLKADQNFLYLSSRISGLENGISDRREFYNESVNLNNVRIEQFPELLIAKLFNFAPIQLLSFSEEERRDPDLQQLFEERR